ncbi:MAG: TauD/TfdA family dioxygenase [Gammaproteobacteria bacterium]
MSTVTTYRHPFDLADDAAYRRWRDWKLDAYPATVEDLIVPIGAPGQLAAAERDALLTRCCKANMAIYAVRGEDVTRKGLVRDLGRQFGLERLDGNLRADEDSISSLCVKPETENTHYIPYTNRPLNWHTDGYYNTLDEQVRGIVMHCVSEPASGGDNLFLDHEVAYIQLRDANPDYIRALMQPDAMTIPANVEQGIEIRPAQTGPVFSLETGSGALHMRYTARTRSIHWKDDRNTQQAAGFLAEFLASDSPCIFRHRLRAGQGIICNNILHKREAFRDDPDTGRTRLLYRARYHDRIRGTEPATDQHLDSLCSG